MTEQEVLELVKEQIENVQSRKDRPVRVAINGIEGTGKTVFAEKLTQYLTSFEMLAIQVSIDGFHFNKEKRYQQGRNSAKGYYENSYDETAFVNKVLVSSQSEYPNYTMAIHDLESDEYLDMDPIGIDHKTIIITDGAYLFKPKYLGYWDLKIYLKTDFEIALNRGVKRDQEKLGGPIKTGLMFEERYHQASKIYLKENNPERVADIIIDNSDFNNLQLVKNTSPASLGKR